MCNDAVFLPECSRQVRALIHRADPRKIAKTLARFATDSTITVKYHVDRGGDLLRRSQLTDHIGWTTCLLARARQTRLELSTAGSERAVQDYDQAACNEVHLAVTQATEMSTAQTVHINLSFGFSRAVGRASDTSNDKVLYQPINPIARQFVFRKNVKKAPTSIAEFLYVPVRKHLFGAMSKFSKSGVHSRRSRTLVSMKE